MQRLSYCYELLRHHYQCNLKCHYTKLHNLNLANPENLCHEAWLNYRQQLNMLLLFTPAFITQPMKPNHMPDNLEIILIRKALLDSF